MSIFFPTKAKVMHLPPLHRDLALQQRLGAMQSIGEWHQFLASVAQHDVVTGHRAKYALPTHFLEVALPLLRVLLADSVPDRPVGLAFCTATGAYGPEFKLPDVGIRRGVKEKYAFDVPLQATATLRDGSSIEVRELRRTRHRSWRQTRGRKTKWKSRSKISHRPVVALTLPKGVEPVQPTVPPPGTVRVQVKPSRRARVTVSLKAASEPSLEAVLDLMTEAFRWSPTAGVSAPADPRGAS